MCMSFKVRIIFKRFGSCDGFEKISNDYDVSRDKSEIYLSLKIASWMCLLISKVRWWWGFFVCMYMYLLYSWGFFYLSPNYGYYIWLSARFMWINNIVCVCFAPANVSTVFLIVHWNTAVLAICAMIKLVFNLAINFAYLYIINIYYVIMNVYNMYVWRIKPTTNIYFHFRSVYNEKGHLKNSLCK